MPMPKPPFTAGDIRELLQFSPDNSLVVFEVCDEDGLVHSYTIDALSKQSDSITVFQSVGDTEELHAKRIEKIKKMHAAGCTNVQIAGQMFMHESSIRHILKENK